MSIKVLQRARSIVETHGDLNSENQKDNDGGERTIFEKYNLEKKEPGDLIEQKQQKPLQANPTQNTKEELQIDNPNSGSFEKPTIYKTTLKKNNIPYLPEESHTEKFKREKREMMPQSRKKILHTLESHFIFSNLTPAQIEEYVLPKLFACRVEKGNYIFKQGENGHIFFVIEEGVMSIEIGGEKKREIYAGDNFGELAILYNSPRSASIQALVDTKLWGLDRTTFTKIIAETIIKQYTMTRRFIDTVNFFERLDIELKDAIASALIPHNYSEGDIIVRQGDAADSFYIIKEGLCVIYNGQEKVRELSTGSFGEQALFEGGQRQRTVIAGCATTCLVLGRDVCTRILGDSRMKSIAMRNSQKWLIEQSQTLKILSPNQKDKVIDRMRMSDGINGQTLIKKKTPKRQKIYFIIEGKIFTQIGKRTFQKNQVIGDEYVSNKDESGLYEDEYIFQIPTKFGEISYDALDEILQEEETPIQAVVSNQSESNIVSKEEIHFQDLILLKRINLHNENSNTIICIVKKKGSTELYILKCISKYMAVENNREINIKGEKDSLQIIRSPYFVDFERTFKDDEYVYFLMRYIQGIVMSRHLRNIYKTIGSISMDHARFYIGQLILALEYLHSLYIIHRDLKPENIIIQKDGYLRIIDLGISKIFSKENWGCKTYSIIGTPHYMAPEIIKSKGYSYPVDYWSLGVIMYEIICGHLPFGEEKENDPYEIYEEIWKKEVKYPSKVTDKKAMRLMNQLLSKDPDVRIGGSFVVLRSDPWFEDLDWRCLDQQEVRYAELEPKEVEFTLSQKYLEEEKVNPKFVKEEIKNFSRPYHPTSKHMASRYYPQWDSEF